MFRMSCAIAAACCGSVACADLVSFNDLADGDTFAVGSSLVSDGVTMNVESFLGDNFVRIDDQGLAGGDGLDAEINNARLSIDFASQFGGSTASVVLFFGEYGGGNGLTVNGTEQTTGDLLTLDGLIIGGATVEVLDFGAVPGGQLGRIQITGAISSFGIAGQELWVDNIRFATVPAPAGALALGGLGLIARRRR